MNFSLPHIVSSVYLNKCDEIKINAQRKDVIGIIEKYPDKQFVLQTNGDRSGKGLKMLKEKSENKITIETSNLKDIELCRKFDIPFFWQSPAFTFEELRIMKDIGCSQARIAAPIFFDLNNVKTFNLPIRVVANMVTHDGMYPPRENGLHGDWLLPQDLDLYEPYISTIEFSETDSVKLEALFDIYSKDKKYSGDLNLLIRGFDMPSPVLAQAIPRDVRETRLNCKQRCSLGRCALCDKGLQVGLTVQKEFLKDSSF